MLDALKLDQWHKNYTWN